MYVRIILNESLFIIVFWTHNFYKKYFSVWILKKVLTYCHQRCYNSYKMIPVYKNMIICKNRSELHRTFTRWAYWNKIDHWEAYLWALYWYIPGKQLYLVQWGIPTVVQIHSLHPSPTGNRLPASYNAPSCRHSSVNK